MKKDSIRQIILVTVVVCLICSVLVSFSAVVLRDLQQANKKLNRNANILIAAGVLSEDGYDSAEVRRLFSDVTTRLLDLRTGKFTEEISAEEYEHLAAQRDPNFSRALNRQEDIASIQRLEHYVPIYILPSAEGEELLVLPIRGYGLWSTLYGYMALGGDDYNWIHGLTFSDHAETPGLGGEVDNPKWKAQWRGKKLFDEEGRLSIRVGRLAERVAYSGKDDQAAAKPPAKDDSWPSDGSSGATESEEEWKDKDGSSGATESEEKWEDKDGSSGATESEEEWEDKDGSSGATESEEEWEDKDGSSGATESEEEWEDDDGSSGATESEEEWEDNDGRSWPSDGSSGATNGANDEYAAIDALSGASLTTRGINNMLRFWFSELGYLKFINNLKKNQA